jgi:hypothetical protein
MHGLNPPHSHCSNAARFKYFGSSVPFRQREYASSRLAIFLNSASFMELGKAQCLGLGLAPTLAERLGLP